MCMISISFAQNAWDGKSVKSPAKSGNNYNINSAEELAWVAQECNNGNGKGFVGKTLILKNNIDLGNNEWIPIGTPENPFGGTFNGNMLKIRNFKVSSTSEDYAGLFGCAVSVSANKVTFNNVRVANADIKGNNYVGGLCGYAERAAFSQCSVDSSTIEGSEYVGGFAGSIKNSAAGECYTCDIELTASSKFGGLFAGANDTSKISTLRIDNSYAKGTITCATYGGGFVGFNAYMSKIKNCYCIVVFSGKGSKLGLFCGLNDTLGIMENCAFNSNLNGNLAKTAVFEDHNHLDYETDLYGETKDAFKTQNFYGNFVNGMNQNTAQWNRDFIQFPINDGHPILKWQSNLYNYVADISNVEIRLYPNPLRNTLYIKSNNDIQKVEIINTLGQNIAQYPGRESIDMSNYRNGVYIVRIHTDAGVVTEKIVKQ